MSRHKSPSLEVEHHHQDAKLRNTVVIFDFHHSCIQIYNIKTHEVIQNDIETTHSQNGGKFKTFLEEYYVGGFPIENYPPAKGGKAVLDDIPEKPIKDEIIEFFKHSITMLASRTDDVRHLVIVCGFKHFPLRRFFNSTMKKFDCFAKVPLKFMSQVSAAYLPYFYDSGNFDALRRNRYCLIFRQTNKRIDTILFKNVKNRLKVINSIHRVIDNSGLNEDELIEILETIRTVKNVIEDCDFYIFELKKRGIENIFNQIIDTENPVKFLAFDESRFGLNKLFYDRMGLDFDVVAHREEEFLKLSQIGKYAPTTMQGSSTTSHQLKDDQKLEDKCKFPLRRPPPLPGRIENTDPYGETSISPLQWNSFIRTAKLLPESSLPYRVISQRHMIDGEVAEAPPLEIVEIMCEDAMQQEEATEESYMNFDDEWLEKNMGKLEELEIIDFESAIDPLIDQPIQDSDEEYVLADKKSKKSKKKKKVVIKVKKEAEDESEEEIMQQLTMMVERKSPVESKTSVQESLKQLFNIASRAKAPFPKRQISWKIENDPPEEDEMPVMIPSPKKKKLEPDDSYLNSAPCSSSKPAWTNNVFVNQNQVLLSQLLSQQQSYLADDPCCSSKPPKIAPISHHNSTDSEGRCSKPPMIQQISQHNSVDSDDRPGSSPLEFLYKEQPPILERQVPIDDVEMGEAAAPAALAMEGVEESQASTTEVKAPESQPSTAAVAPESQPSTADAASEVKESESKPPISSKPKKPAKPKSKKAAAAKPIKSILDKTLHYPLPDFDAEPHLRQIFPFCAKLYDNQWDFERNVSFKDIGYADKNPESPFYLTPAVPDGTVLEQMKYLQEHFPTKFADILPHKQREKERAVNIVKEEEEGTPLIIERMRLKTIHIQPDVELLLKPDWCNPLRGRAKKLKVNKNRKKKKKRTLDEEVLDELL